MKRKIILTLIMSAMLLTACHNEGQSINTAETTAETAKNTEEELTEAENNSRLKMHFFDYKSIDPSADEYSGYSEFIILNDNILYIPFGTFYDINENTLVNKFDPTSNWELKDTVDDSKKIIYKNTIYDWNGDSQEYAVCTVYADQSFELAKNTMENNLIQHYDRKLSLWGGDLMNAETGEMLIKGYKPNMEGEYNEEYGWEGASPFYKYPLDENRFVYHTMGANALTCIGVYDLEKNEAREIPNSSDFKPLGVRDGKIYLADGLHNFETDKVTILTANPDTLETEVYMEWSKNGDMQTAMSADGKYIALLYSGTQRLYVIKTDTGESFVTDIDEKFTNPCPICFADNDTVIVANWSDKILLIDITE